jgi:hypothetical protein
VGGVWQDSLTEESAPSAGFEDDAAIQRVDHLDVKDVGVV